MNGSLLRDAFDHHVWATVRLIDACLALPPDQLTATAPGLYGSIIETLRHVVGGDTAYLTAFSPDVAHIDEDAMGLAELRAEMALNGPRWREVLARDLDPTAIVVRHRANGSESHAPLGIRLAQAIHHGTDHRSQVCTILSTLGVEPPDIDTWAFAESQGRIRNVPPPPGAGTAS